MTRGLDTPISHVNSSLQDLTYILMNIIGCLIFTPKLFSIFTWINMFCIIGATVLLLLWGSKKSNVDYLSVSSTSSTDLFGSEE